MSTKTNGAEFKAFYADPQFWPYGVWHDADVVLVNGEYDSEAKLDRIEDDALVVIESGYVIGAKDEDLGLLESYFKKWRKAQTRRCMLVEISKDDGDKLAELVKQIGGKVVA